MKGLLLSVERQKAEFVDIEKNFERYYELMNCDTVEYAYRRVGGIPFLFVCDENALMVSDPLISAVSRSMGAMLFGSLLVYGATDDGNARDLTDEEVDILKNNVCYVGTVNHPRGLLVIKDVEYLAA